MIQKMRNVLSRIYRKFFSAETPKIHGWFGNYSSWDLARAAAKGYDSKEILEKVKTALLKVKNGEAAYERDSVAFAELEMDDQVLKGLQLASEKQKELRIVDFGGSLGSTYFQYRNLMNEIKIKSWAVIEQNHFVEVGKENFETNGLKFHYRIADAIEQGKSQTLLLFSVLPYLENPYFQIPELMNHGFEYILIDRTPIIEAADRITVQVVPEFIYKASYPAWFFNEKKMLAAFESKYELIQSYNSKFASPYMLEDGIQAVWKGYILKRK
jgi:putative methyltransferase (TIGR04325 family)